MDIKTNQEFHKNGQLAYAENILIVPANTSHLYQNKRINDAGVEWVRVGEHAKYYDNGQLAWMLRYNEFGDVIKDNAPSYRKDGTIIQH
jgi:hypothetical protein